MKLLGIEPFKKEDTIDQIAKLKAVMGSVTDLIPNGAKVERPGIMEKLIDTIGPILPKLVGDVKSMMDNAALAQQIQAMRMQQTAQIAGAPPELGAPLPQRPTTRYGQPVGPAPNRVSHADAFREEPDYDPYSGFETRPFEGPRVGAPSTGPVAPAQSVSAPSPVSQEQAQLPPLLAELRELITHDRRDAYEALYQTLLQYPESKMMIDGIAARVVTAENMTEQLRQYGGATFNEPAFVNKMLAYFDGFIAWVHANHQAEKVTVKCARCQAVHTFESASHFESIEKKCTADVGVGQVCGGDLVRS